MTVVVAVIKMNVINDLVGYKKLKIVQNADYFNFSLDSVLLPNFIHLKKTTNKIIDFCTGNAPIPLILSTMTDAEIIGVEIQKEIYDLAVESININNLNDKIKIINKDVKELYEMYESDSVDLITCNPPYFEINEETLRNKNEIKTNARHETLLNLEDILKVSKKILKNNAPLVMVHRTERLADIIFLFKTYNIEPKRIRFIYPKKDTPSNIVLIEGVKNGNKGLKMEFPLIVHDKDGNYTDEVLEMFE